MQTKILLTQNRKETSTLLKLSRLSLQIRQVLSLIPVEVIYLLIIEYGVW